MPKPFEFGPLPDGWKLRKLAELTPSDRPIVYGIVQAGPHVHDGVPYLRSTDVGDRIDVQSLRRTSKEIAARYKRANTYPGDLVFSLRGDIGEMSIVPPDLPLVNLTQGTARISPNRTVTVDYLRHALSSPVVVATIAAVSKGSTFREISIEQLRDLVVPVPGLPEQQEISRIISSWDRGMRQLSDLIAAKLRFKQGLMQQLLTGKRRFTEYTGQQWCRVHLGELLKEVSRYVDWNDDEEYRLVSIRRRSGGMFYRESKHGRDIKTQVMKTTEVGDFVIARMQAVHGAMAVTPPQFDGFHVSDSYSTFVARDPQRLSMYFLDYLSRTPMYYRLALLSAYGVTIEKMTFNLDWFLAESVLIPPTLEEQDRIAVVLRTCDTEIGLLQQEMDFLERQKKGLRQKLLTGEVRVKLPAGGA